jgi:hypothetical protein
MVVLMHFVLQALVQIVVAHGSCCSVFAECSVETATLQMAAVLNLPNVLRLS